MRGKGEEERKYMKKEMRERKWKRKIKYIYVENGKIFIF